MIWPLVAVCWLGLAEPDALSSDDLDAYVDQVVTLTKACGPTSAWYCLRRLGHSVELRDLWREAPVTDNGVNLQRVIELLRAHEVSAEAVVNTAKDFRWLTPPAILVVDENHCVVFEGLTGDGDEVKYFEPERCRLRTAPRAELQDRWSGEAIIFEAPVLSQARFFVLASAAMFVVLLPGVLLCLRLFR